MVYQKVSLRGRGLILLIFTLAVSFSSAASEVKSASLAYYSSEFYNALEHHVHDSELKNLLNKILKSAHLKQSTGLDQLAPTCPSSNTQDCYQHRGHSYDEARKFLFGTIHLEFLNQRYQVKCVYCSVYYGPEDFPRGSEPGPGRIPDNNVMNTEHTWPQSRFTNKYPANLQKADVHILYPVWQKVNSTRSNYPFGEVATIKSQPCPASKLGYAQGNQQSLVFEPPEGHKGAVARAIFYFVTRYEISLPDSEESYLRRWHQNEPVNNFERDRNDAVFAFQNDRNPFVDYPELVDMIANF